MLAGIAESDGEVLVTQSRHFSTNVRRVFALPALALEHPAKGLPDSSDPIRRDGLQGQVLATPANWNAPSHSL